MLDFGPYLYVNVYLKIFKKFNVIIIYIRDAWTRWHMRFYNWRKLLRMKFAK